MAFECDGCYEEVHARPVGVFQRRPSDPAEICAVLYYCGPCAVKAEWSPDVLPGDQVPTLATYDQAEVWVETFGQAHGVLFVG